MCLPLIGRVVAIEGELAEVTLLDGKTVRAIRATDAGVVAGQHVLLDRGLIVEVVSAEEVEHMLAFFTELTEMWTVEPSADPLPVTR